MTEEAPRTSYEELRQRNVERNESFMRSLGLLPSRCGEEYGKENSPGQKKLKNVGAVQGERRRSERLLVKPRIPCEGGRPETIEEIEPVAAIQVAYIKVTKKLTWPSTLKTPESGKAEVPVQDEDVDDRILSLQRELQRLQKSREVGFRLNDGSGCSGSKNVGAKTAELSIDSVSKGMKENVEPGNVNAEGDDSKVTGKRRRLDSQKQESGTEKLSGKRPMQSDVEDGQLWRSASDKDLENVQMDCGDLVKIYAFSRGRKEEIGKGIVIGLAGTKFAKKDIPEGWCSIKCTSHTESGGLKICPFPPGWTEQLRKKTVKEVNGKCMLWPNMLLRSLMDQ